MKRTNLLWFVTGLALVLAGCGGAKKSAGGGVESEPGPLG
jgi:hypothetical protein